MGVVKEKRCLYAVHTGLNSENLVQLRSHAVGSELGVFYIYVLLLYDARETLILLPFCKGQEGGKAAGGTLGAECTKSKRSDGQSVHVAREKRPVIGGYCQHIDYLV